MSTLDVALRLKLINQLSGEAAKAARDLTGIKTAAKGIEGTRGADKLKRDLLDVSTASRNAGRGLGEVKREATGLGAVRGPDKLKRDLLGVASAARLAERAMASVKTAAQRVRERGAGGPGVGGPRPIGAEGRSAPLLMGGSLSTVARAYGAYALGRRFAQGYTDMAAFDRQMTRIGITGEATAEQLAAAKKQVRDLSFEFGIAQAEAVKGVEALVTQGLSLPQALAQMRSVLAAAQASGAAVDDIAKTGGALTTNLAVKVGELERAFDVLAYAGKKGQFELKDAAQYLPMLAASWSNAGQKGIDKLADLAAALQIVRKQTGTSEQAFNGVRDLLAKLYQPEVQKNFKKVGIDLEDSLSKGLKAGRPLFDLVIDLVKKATKGDLAQLPKFFGEIDSRQAVSALVNLENEFKSLRSEIKRSSAGTIAKDLPAVINDTESGIKRLSDSWSGFWRSTGRLADSAGASTALAKITDGANAAADALDRLSTPEGRRAAADEFSTNQAKGSLDARIREVGEKLRQREQAIRGAGAAPLSSFPGRFQSGAKAQADRRAADVGTDAEVKALRAKLNDLIQERQNLGGVKPVITEKDLEAGRAAVARDKARDRYFDIYPTLRGNKPATAGGSLPPVQLLDDAVSQTAGAKAKAAMDGIDKAISTGGEKAIATTQSFVERMKALLNSLNVTVAPTISPRFNAPGVGGGGGGGGGGGDGAPKAPGKQSSRGPVTVVVNVNGAGDAQAVGREVARQFARLGDSTGALFDRV
ncbi:MAG: phage tail tape measure protein [Rhodoplanes sp.]|uniref:phage tail tape measure protein n=1 Tax=Rhodoplanes sp. TaxID=1968906 RepID=UPI0018251FF1|nr:phage tail tape measure protein [Rhodoplanes sp.]NVO16098.1 phage tail tape measure protein [Rhodoplanes sp.]